MRGVVTGGEARDIDLKPSLVRRCKFPIDSGILVRSLCCRYSEFNWTHLPIAAITTSNKTVFNMLMSCQETTDSLTCIRSLQISHLHNTQLFMCNSCSANHVKSIQPLKPLPNITKTTFEQPSISLKNTLHINCVFKKLWVCECVANWKCTSN